MAVLYVAVSASGLAPAMVETVRALAGSGDAQRHTVTVVHVAKVWGTSLGLQHGALQPNAEERGAARDVASSAALELRRHDVAAEALVIAGRDVGKTLAGAAQRARVDTIVVGRGSRGRLGQLLRGADPARVLLARTSCTLVVVAGASRG